MTGLITIGYFLFSSAFGLITFLLWARIALHYFKVSSLHPVSQAINSLMDPVLLPVMRLLHLKKSRFNPFDWAAFSLLVVVEFLKFIFIGLFFLNGLLPLFLIVLYVCGDLIVQPCNLLFYALILRVIMSWLNPNWQHPIADVLRMITEPVLRFGRRIIPDISGFDFSPFIMIIIFKVISLFIHASLPLL